VEPRQVDEWTSLFRCPRCQDPLVEDPAGLSCPSAHRFPVVRGIPRFVEGSAYLESFSREWNTHDRTQLDSERGEPLSERTLRTKLGLTPADVAGKLVLDAGVGAGRYAEVLARWGAQVIGIDLSLAVEAAHRNLAGYRNVRVAQADLMACPFAPGTFDWIVSIGVLHHTPDTRRAVEALIPLLKPGGTLAAWVYPDEGAYRTRACWIPFTSWLVRLTHRRLLRPMLLPFRLFFPYSRQGLGIEWDVLDTFDGYSPRYHGVHAPSEVIAWFRGAGLIEVREAGPIHTAVRGQRPVARPASAAG
jgi:SAM-dependent methyltransferase